MSIDKDTVQKIAHLARLDPNDVQHVNNDLNNILNLVDLLKEVDVNGIETMAHPLDSGQRLRADIAKPVASQARCQDIAPATESGLYLVPQVIE